MRTKFCVIFGLPGRQESDSCDTRALWLEVRTVGDGRGTGDL